jgi:hypothetical protein
MSLCFTLKHLGWENKKLDIQGYKDDIMIINPLECPREEDGAMVVGNYKLLTMVVLIFFFLMMIL